MIESRILRWAGLIVTKEDGRIALKILTGKPTEKKTLERQY